MEPQNPPIVPETPIVKPIKTEKPFPILLIVLGVLLILSLVGSGFLFLQNITLQKQISSLKIAQVVSSPVPVTTPDPTANWQTFISTQYGFSFKYPINFSILDNNEAGISNPWTGNPQMIGALGDKMTIVQGTESVFSGFGISSVSLGNLSFSDFMANEVSVEKNSPRGISNEKINQLALASGYQAAYIDSEANIRRYFIFNSKNNTAIVLSTASEAVLLDGTMDKILSTFKFTN